MSFDEDEFGSASHVRSPLEDSFNVSRFIPRGDNDRYYGFRCAFSHGTCDHKVGESHLTKGPQTDQETICKPAQWQRPENFLCDPDRLKVSQTQQSIDVVPRQPVLEQGLSGKIEPARNPKWDLPEPTVKIQDDTRMSRAERLELFEDTLYIPEIVDQIGQNDDIKFFVEPGEVMGICLEKFKFRIMVFCAADHFLRKI